MHFVQILFEEFRLKNYYISSKFFTLSVPEQHRQCESTELQYFIQGKRSVNLEKQKIVGKSIFQNHIFSLTYGNPNGCCSPHYSSFFSCTNALSYEHPNT